MQILIAEDDRASRGILTAIMPKWGYEPVAVDEKTGRYTTGYRAFETGVSHGPKSIKGRERRPDEYCHERSRNELHKFGQMAGLTSAMLKTIREEIETFASTFEP